MSGGKEGKDNSSVGTESATTEKPVKTKKYPFQTVTHKNNREKVKLKTTENVIDKQAESKNKMYSSKDTLTEVLTPREDTSSKLDPPENTDLRTRLSQTTKTLMKNEVELEVITVAEKTESRETISRKDLTKKEIDEICSNRNDQGGYTKTKTPGLDPRFQQQNQTMRCFVMYTDFYRCENILGEGESACQWFKDVFTSICPLDWIRRWDEAREEGRFGWPKGRTQGKFPGNRYGN